MCPKEAKNWSWEISKETSKILQLKLLNVVHKLLASLLYNWLQKSWTRCLHAKIVSFFCFKNWQQNTPVAKKLWVHWGILLSVFWNRKRRQLQFPEVTPQEFCCQFFFHSELCFDRPTCITEFLLAYAEYLYRFLLAFLFFWSTISNGKQPLRQLHLVSIIMM